MINIEYQESLYYYPKFIDKIKGKTVGIICDINTEKYALNVKDMCDKVSKTLICTYQDHELIPSEDKIEVGIKFAEDVDYVLVVGSGTLNDMGKYIGTVLNIPTGVFATAPSMDGYLSKGSALYEKSYKVTKEVNMPADVLVHLDTLANAPKLMIASGVGDILGKITCLTDWKLSNIVNNEPIHEEGFKLMEEALNACLTDFDAIVNYNKLGIKKLMDALITAGLSMAIVGNSRPASGSEHHISHYLEMDFVKKQLPVPFHGIKVALGTLVALELYHGLLEVTDLPHKEEITQLVNTLPTVNEVKDMLIKAGCPIRFSEINVAKETFIEMFYNAHKVRDRFTILTFISKLGLHDYFLPRVLEKYF